MPSTLSQADVIEYSEPPDLGDAWQIAIVVDEVRNLVVDAWRRGATPQYLLVDPSLATQIRHLRQTDIAVGAPVCLLGLLVVDAHMLDRRPERPVIHPSEMAGTGGAYALSRSG